MKHIELQDTKAIATALKNKIKMNLSDYENDSNFYSKPDTGIELESLSQDIIDKLDCVSDEEFNGWLNTNIKTNQ